MPIDARPTSFSMAAKPERVVRFDGNYAEAARRVALLLRLAANETSDGNKR